MPRAAPMDPIHDWSTRSLSAQHRALIFHQPKGEQCNERIGCIYDTIGEKIQKKHGE